MKKMVNVTEVEGEGLVGLLGKRVLIMCNSYFYTGMLTGVNSSCVLLDDAGIVYQTGAWASKDFEDCQKVRGSIYVQLSAIEAFMETDKK